MKKHLFSLILFCMLSSVYAGIVPYDTLYPCNAGFSYEYYDQELSSVRKVAFHSFYNSPTALHEWSMNDSVFSHEANPDLHYYGMDSNLKICHNVFDNDCTFCTYCDYIFNDLPQCTAYFEAYPDSMANCNCMGAYRFYDHSTGNPVSWNWDFGDGEFSDVQNPFHAYSDTGLFMASLKITTSAGCESNYEVYIIVGETNNCNLSISYTPSQLHPFEYHFYSNLSIIDSADISSLSFFWDFGDGNYSLDPVANHIYLQTGVYTVTLSVTYPGGAVCTSFITSNFNGKNIFHDCNYSGTFIRNYAGQGFDAIISNNGFFYIVQMLPEIYLPDGANIWFSYSETGDTAYSGDTIFRGIIVECIDTETHPFYTGTVKDYTGLDGCGYVIELDNGTVLEPVKVDEYFQFSHLLRVRLTYREMENVATICMMGLPVEITYIEATGDTIIPPPCNEILTLHTSTLMNSEGCNGIAYLSIDNCQPWLSSVILPEGYQVYWSTGETGFSVDQLCQNQLYMVTVITPSGMNYTTAFSIFRMNSYFPAWNYTAQNEVYYFNLPVETGYEVAWMFNDGITQYGSNISHTFNHAGVHSVELVVKDAAGNEVHRETIQLNLVSQLPEEFTEKVNLFPVPAGDHLFMDLPETMRTNIRIMVSDVSGRIVINRNVPSAASREKIDLSGMQQGFYILTVSGNNKSYTVKFDKR